MGRPPKETEENKERLRELKAQRIRDSRERIPIEGKFGQGKNGYRLNYIQIDKRFWTNKRSVIFEFMFRGRQLGCGYQTRLR